MEKKFKLGDFVYKLYQGTIHKFKIKKVTTSEELFQNIKIVVAEYLLEDVEDPSISEICKEDSVSEFYLTYQELIDNLVRVYKSRYEKDAVNYQVPLEFYETDGYTDKHRSYIKIPIEYIKSEETHSVILTDSGVDWFKNNVSYNFDNGGYYRLRRVSEDIVSELIATADNILYTFS